MQESAEELRRKADELLSESEQYDEGYAFEDQLEAQGREYMRRADSLESKIQELNGEFDVQSVYFSRM